MHEHRDNLQLQTLYQDLQRISMWDEEKALDMLYLFYSDSNCVKWSILDPDNPGYSSSSHMGGTGHYLCHEYCFPTLRKEIIKKLAKSWSRKSLFCSYGSSGGYENVDHLAARRELGKKCFIATAAYGTSMAPDVRTLSEFRDQHLLSHTWGRLLIRFYESLSPPLAAFIATSYTGRMAARYLLIKPLILIIRMGGRLGRP